MTRRRTARIRTAVLEGLAGIEVTAEIDISRGLPGFHLVGLPGAVVRESRERVQAALRNAGRKVPPGRITVNLAPAAVRKVGASTDLAIALGVLAAGRTLRTGPVARTGAAFIGELSLFGDVRPVRGLLPMVMELAAAGCRAVVVPAAQAAEARLVGGIGVVGVRDLASAVAWWEGGAPPPESGGRPVRAAAPTRDGPLWTDLVGLPTVRKAAVIAAAGRHHCLLVGPPGTGKTRLARGLGRAAGCLPPAHALEVTRIRSVTGAGPVNGLVTDPPFRAPHHSVTRAGLVGGGSALRPGEATLAHRGILFLDELSEYPPTVLDSLREPLEEGRITVARGAGSRVYPARFQLVAAMNPCRCGFLGSSVRRCSCSDAEIRRHRARLSGPLLDRIELFVEFGSWDGDLPSPEPVEPRRVEGGSDWREAPRHRDLARARALLARPSGFALAPSAAAVLAEARRVLGLSLRGVDRCRRVAATVAALDGTRRIGRGHVREALEYRRESVLVAPVPDPGS